MGYNLKIGVTCGAVYCGITLLLFQLFGNSINFTTKFFLDFVLLNIVLYVFLYFPIKRKIYSLSEPKFYYGEGMKSGFGATFFASIFIVIFMFIFYNYINKDFLSSIKDSTLPQLNKAALDSLKKSNSIKTLIANSSPVTLMLQQFAFTIISGMVASFIIGAFTSKSKSQKDAEKRN